MHRAPEDDDEDDDEEGDAAVPVPPPMITSLDTSPSSEQPPEQAAAGSSRCDAAAMAPAFGHAPSPAPASDGSDSLAGSPALKGTSGGASPAPAFGGLTSGLDGVVLFDTSPKSADRPLEAPHALVPAASDFVLPASADHPSTAIRSESPFARHRNESHQMALHALVRSGSSGSGSRKLSQLAGGGACASGSSSSSSTPVPVPGCSGATGRLSSHSAQGSPPTVLPCSPTLVHKATLLSRSARGAFSFPESASRPVGPGARAFITSLLQVDSGCRLSADQALQHSWLDSWTSVSEDGEVVLRVSRSPARLTKDGIISPKMRDTDEEGMVPERRIPRPGNSRGKQEAANAWEVRDRHERPSPLERGPLERSPLERSPLERTPLEVGPLENASSGQSAPLDRSRLERTSPPRERTPLERTPLERAPLERALHDQRADGAGWGRPSPTHWDVSPPSAANDPFRKAPAAADDAADGRSGGSGGRDVGLERPGLLERRMGSRDRLGSLDRLNSLERLNCLADSPTDEPSGSRPSSMGERTGSATALPLSLFGGSASPLLRPGSPLTMSPIHLSPKSQRRSAPTSSRESSFSNLRYLDTTEESSGAADGGGGGGSGSAIVRDGDIVASAPPGTLGGGNGCGRFGGASCARPSSGRSVLAGTGMLGSGLGSGGAGSSRLRGTKPSSILPDSSSDEADDNEGEGGKFVRPASGRTGRAAGPSEPLARVAATSPPAQATSPESPAHGVSSPGSEPSPTAPSPGSQASRPPPLRGRPGEASLRRPASSRTVQASAGHGGGETSRQKPLSPLVPRAYAWAEPDPED